MVAGDPHRGEVYRVNLSEHGGTLRKKRPVLVIQNDIGNRMSPVTIVVPIHDLHGGRMLPIFVAVEQGIGGLEKQSVVDTGHINTIDKSVLIERVGEMPREVMVAVDRALHVSLGLTN